MLAANSLHFCIRRIHSGSSHWRESDRTPTSACFNDEEVSVDINLSLPLEMQLKEKYREFISKGFGLAVSQILPINDVLEQNKIVDEQGSFGKVFHQPIPDNPDHGVITGKKNNRKAKLLRDVFKNNIIIEPKKFNEVYK
ncbi:MAG: hypothetical protein KBC84_01660 [Proteobacteria bacterium]|nr:hypothetical protein [Pseudomonadota bacterium]